MSTVPATGYDCGLTARISRLSSADRMLVERLIETLEARAAQASETPEQRVRRRIEAVRSRTD